MKTKKYEPYEPYKLEYLPKLMQFFYSKGWYGGTLDLLTITMKGGFEAFTGRASETWEHKFFVKNCAIPDIGITENEASGDTLDIACRNLLQKFTTEEK